MQTVNDQESVKQNLIARIKKIEGQVRGIGNMLEEERYCVDVLLQITAVRAALKKVGLAVLQQHTTKCVDKAVKEDRSEEMIHELIDVLDKFMK